MHRRLVAPLAALALLVSVVLSACGGGGGTPLSRADFTDLANKACKNLTKANDDLMTAEGEAVTGKELTKRFAAAADGLAAFADELGEPEPPSIIASQVGKLVDDVSTYSDLLRDLGNRAKPNQDYQELQHAHQPLVMRLNDIAGRTTTLIAELQFGGCLPRVP